MKKRFAGLFEFGEATTTLVGTIVGAGVLAIPYAMMKAGFLTGLLIMCILSAAVIILYLYVGEIVLRTKGNHQLPGYAKKYLGSAGKGLMAFSMVFSIYGALIAYLIGIGESSAAIFGLQGHSINLFGSSLSVQLGFSLLFFIFAASVIFFGIKSVGKSELILSSVIIGIVVLLSIIIMPRINPSNLASFNISKIFLPFGVILFALAGALAIPEMKEELVKNKKKLKKAIIIGTLIPIILYFIFSIAVVGNCGNGTSEIATICLGNKFGFWMLLGGNLFAIFAMATSFLTLGLALKEMYSYDYRIREKIAWLLACIVPLLLFFLVLFFVKQERFFSTIGVTGGIAMTLEGILIVIMFNRAKKLGKRKPEYSIKRSKIISLALITMFLLAMLYTMLDFAGFI